MKPTTPPAISATPAIPATPLATLPAPPPAPPPASMLKKTLEAVAFSGRMLMLREFSQGEIWDKDFAAPWLVFILIPAACWEPGSKNRSFLACLCLLFQSACSYDPNQKLEQKSQYLDRLLKSGGQKP